MTTDKKTSLTVGLFGITFLSAVAVFYCWRLYLRPAQEAQERPVKDVRMLPEYSEVYAKIHNIFGAISQPLDRVTDASTAESEAKTIAGLGVGSQIDSLKLAWSKLTGKSVNIKKEFDERLSKLNAQIERVYAIPGAAEKLKPTVDPLLGKLTALWPQ